MPADIGISLQNEPIFDDGVAYHLNWTPFYEFVAKEGDAVLFPPGWIHETFNVDNGRAVARTTQFDVPHSVGYHRSYYSRLRRSGDISPRWNRVISWASIQQRIPKLNNKADARKFAQELYKKQTRLDPGVKTFYDCNRDGKVFQTEFVEVFVQWWLTEMAVQQEPIVGRESGRMLAFDMGFAPEAKVAPECAEL